MKLNSTRKGYYEVHVDGEKQSRHTSVTEVIAKGFELKSNNLGAEVRIKQPDLLIDVELSDNIEELKDRIRELEKSEAMYIQIIESLSGGGGSQSVDVTSVTIEPSTATISVGETQQLKETILPANASNKTGVWSTSNANATVSQNGLVTAVTEGSSIITFTTTDGSFTDTTTITVEAFTGLDADALNYIDLVGTFTEAEKVIVNQYFEDLKTQGIWSKLHASYLLLKGTPEAHKWNIKNLQDTDAAFRLTYVDDITHDTVGMNGNGSGYANTHYNPSLNAVYGDTHLGFYSGTDTASDHQIDIGVKGADNTQRFSMEASYTDNFAVDLYSLPEGRITASNADSRGFYLASRTSNTSFKAFKDGVQLGSTNTTDITGLSTLPNFEVPLMGWSSNGIVYSYTQSVKDFRLVTIGLGLTDTEAANYSALVEQLQVDFGRSAYASDTEAPTVPQNFIADSSNNNSVTLSWDASTDNVGVVKYNIYEDGVFVKDSTSLNTITTIDSLSSNTTYYFTIDAEDAAGNKSAQSGITQGSTTGIINATGVTVIPSTLDIAEGFTTQLSVAYTPANTSDQTGTWSTSNASFATVSSSGLVTGVAIGSATITYTSNDGGFTDTTVVTVEEAPPVGLKAFPTAIGAGANATGGRGGQVIHVTTLDWDAAGGLKEAIQTQGTRTIVFDVSGEIDATQEGAFEQIITGSDYDNITIAGQTAPAGGITILTSEFSFWDVSNIIIRHLRFRATGERLPGGDWGFGRDALTLNGGQGMILDHCTISYGTDEAFDLGSGFGRTTDATIPMGDITVQNCFMQNSKTGLILGTAWATDDGVGGLPGDFTFVNNCFSNISHRFPNPKGSGQFDIVNNVVYNWRNRLVRVTHNGNSNVVNNYYKPSDEGLRLDNQFGTGLLNNNAHKLQAIVGVNPLIYTAGNIIEGDNATPRADDRETWQIFEGSDIPEAVYWTDDNGKEHLTRANVPDRYFTETQFPLKGHTFPIQSADDAFTELIANGNLGAYKTLNADGSVNVFRDSKDTADLLMIQNDTFTSPDGSAFYYPYNADGYPTIAENTRPAGFYNAAKSEHIPEVWFDANVPNGETHNTISDDGHYTWLERYLNQVDETTVTVKAFPTALGGGSTSRGDVTYTLREVTNLNSTGYGSFWDAFQSNSIVVFRVSGVIDLDIFSTKTVNNVIILGQTAPEGGITITGQRLRFQNSNNVIIRYVRFRPEGTGNDTLEWIDSDNIILDHCSLSFGGDETMTFRGDSDNITVQRSIFSYGKTGSLIGDSGDTSLSVNLSYINNLYTEVSHRIPGNPNSNGRIDVIGNVVYNWNNLLMRSGGNIQLNEIGNYYKKGQNAGLYHQLNMSANPSVYTANNRLTGILEDNADNNWLIWQDWNSGSPNGSQASTNYQTSLMHNLLNYNIDLPNGDESYEDLVTQKNVGVNAFLNNSGSTVLGLDTFDNTAIDNIISNQYNVWNSANDYSSLQEKTDYYQNLITGVILNEHSQITHTGSVPNSWILAQGLVVGTFNPLGNDLSNDYTNIEVYSFNVG